MLISLFSICLEEIKSLFSHQCVALMQMFSPSAVEVREHFRRREMNTRDLLINREEERVWAAEGAFLYTPNSRWEEGDETHTQEHTWAPKNS